MLSLWQLLPSDFVCSVPAHHMLDRLVPARMVGDPCVHLQHLVVYNDNGPAITYEAFYLSTTEHLRLPAALCVHFGGMVREKVQEFVFLCAWDSLCQSKSTSYDYQIISRLTLTKFNRLGKWVKRSPLREGSVR